jgi:hypothetical protein
MRNRTAQSETTGRLVDEIGPMFNGEEPEVIGSVLALLTATWIAGHVAERDETQMHCDLLDAHLTLIKKLIAPMRAQLVEVCFH